MKKICLTIILICCFAPAVEAIKAELKNIRTIYLFTFLLLISLNVLAQQSSDSLKLNHQRKINGYFSFNLGNSYAMIKNPWYSTTWWAVKDKFNFAMLLCSHVVINKYNIILEGSVSSSSAYYQIHNSLVSNYPHVIQETDFVKGEASLDASISFYKLLLKRRKINIAPGLGYYYLSSSLAPASSGVRLLLLSNVFIDKKRNWAIALLIEKRFYKNPLDAYFPNYEIIYPINLFIGIQHKLF